MKSRYFLLLFIVSVNCAYSKNKVKSERIVPTINGLYKFSGKLNNKIPIFIWFIIKDSVLKGEVTYLKTTKRVPITILGSISKEGLEIWEFSKSFKVTGVYHGTFSTTMLKGSWFAPGKSKELLYDLSLKDTTIAVHDMTLKPALINGDYFYDWGTGAVGGIDLKQTSPGNFLMNVNCVTASPNNNLAYIETTKVRMMSNTIIYKVPDGECKYRIRAFNNFVVIDRLSESGGCFGMGAGPEGFFMKRSNIPDLRPQD